MRATSQKQEKCKRTGQAKTAQQKASTRLLFMPLQPQDPQEDGRENLIQELQKLKKELKAVRQRNKRLTDALLDKIGGSAKMAGTSKLPASVSTGAPDMGMEVREASQRSLTGQACRTVESSTVKAPATPEKVDVVKACLQRYVDLHPMGPPAAPPETRVACVRKYLRSYFTEAGRVGKRIRVNKKAQV
ncbi:hypothetical protein HPB52_025682 [Rhipicephalus sanguineus]|uniref:BEN domain-containing protein n=1 Tax=Rhipicephalus sanguineus TaxID=34632 RepID=A0A9D4SM63_RHISA|nr:hypothetical protein HPB52_025682 [Rhipicephalus sanguineus]